MGNNSKNASLATIGLLFVFIFLIFALLFSLIELEVHAVILILMSMLLVIILWFISAKITDFILMFSYYMKFYSWQEFQEQYFDEAYFMQNVCNENGIDLPKIGFIGNDVPLLFVYGSQPSNARMVFTKGFFSCLSQEEREAVIAHEIGHLASNDFIAITTANVLPQVFYESYILFSIKRNSSVVTKRNLFFQMIAYVFYVLYLAALHVILYQSRAREYYADEFSAKSAKDPENLFWALMKIAYEVVDRNDIKSKRIMESTRTLGIIDMNSAKSLGFILEFSDSPDTINKAIAFDLLNPWAFALEFVSTHPLAGRRIKKLNELAVDAGKKGILDIKNVANSATVDDEKLQEGFISGAPIYFLPYLGIIFGFLFGNIIGGGTGAIFVFFGASLIIKSFYKYPNVKGKNITIKELETDIYANPLRGKKIILEGEILKNGSGDEAVGEDMIFHDKTGYMHIDFGENLIGLENMFISINKIKKILGKPVIVEGWYFRGVWQSFSISNIETERGNIQSHPQALMIMTGFIPVLTGLIMMFI